MAPRAPKAPIDPAPESVAEEIVVTEEVADEDVQRYADAMTASSGDGDGDDPAPPELEVIEPSDLDEELIDRATSWPHEYQIDYRVPHVARGKIASQLLAAADELGYPPAAVRSQSDGFLVPSLVYYHLFPSEAPDPADDTE